RPARRTRRRGGLRPRRVRPRRRSWRARRAARARALRRCAARGGRSGVALRERAAGRRGSRRARAPPPRTAPSPTRPRPAVRRRRRAPSDLAEREPVGAEMHTFEGEVDADGEGARPDADQRAVIAQPAPGGAETREDGAQAVELSARSQAERSLPTDHAVSGG